GITAYPAKRFSIALRGFESRPGHFRKRPQAHVSLGLFRRGDAVVGQNSIPGLIDRRIAANDGPVWTWAGATTAAVHKMTVSSAEIHSRELGSRFRSPRDVTARF